MPLALLAKVQRSPEWTGPWGAARTMPSPQVLAASVPELAAV
jgi:hypothetical protein